MVEINFSSYDLNSASQRSALLLPIPRDREVVKRYHRQLLDLFRLEMAYRRQDKPAEGDEDSDYFEHLYWCGLLLYLVGDPADSPLMWEARNISMDTACGFDVQFLVGVGVEETIKYLEEHAETAAADYIKITKSCGDFDDLQGWEEFGIHYYYPERPLRDTHNST
jgi:hypothetical protein